MCRMIKINNFHWSKYPYLDGINDTDKILVTQKNVKKLEQYITNGKIHLIRWIKNPTYNMIKLANKFRTKENGYIHPFLWQDILPEFIVREICKSNWKCYKQISNPTYKIKKDYFNFISNAKWIKKHKINNFIYKLYKPDWDTKNTFNDRLLKRTHHL